MDSVCHRLEVVRWLVIGLHQQSRGLLVFYLCQVRMDIDLQQQRPRRPLVFLDWLVFPAPVAKWHRNRRALVYNYQPDLVLFYLNLVPYDLMYLSRRLV
jgi:hypothetical protein